MLAGACGGGGVGGGSFSSSNGAEGGPLDELRGVGSSATDADLLRDGMEGRGGDVGCRRSVDEDWEGVVDRSGISLGGAGAEAPSSAMGVGTPAGCETGSLRLDPDVCTLRLIPSLSPPGRSSSEIVLDN